MKTKTRKRLVRFLLVPVIALFLLVIAAFAILYTQQERLVHLGVKEINKKLPGELVVDGSNISLFQNFPYISIRLKNVRFYGNKQKTGSPLFDAEKLFVGFSLPDLLKQQYRVKVIFLKNGHLNLVQDTAGKLNIVEAAHIQPDTTATRDSTKTDLDLDVKKIVLRSMAVSFLDKQSGQRIAAQIERIQSSLKDDSLELDANLHGAMVIDYTRPGDTTLFRHKHFSTDLQLVYEKQPQLLMLPVGKLQLEDAAFNITGRLDLLHGDDIDCRFSGDKPNLDQLFAFAPETVTKELKHFRYDGHLNFEGSVKGKLAEDRLPLITLSFSCADAWLHNTRSNKKLDSLAFKGFYTNGADRSAETSELRLLNMHARPGKGIFMGNFVMRDFNNPKILMQVNSDLELGFVGAFLGIKDLQRITGHINLKMNFKELVDISVPEQSMGKLTQGIQSELSVRNLSFRIPHYPYNVEHLNLHAAMKNGFLTLDSLVCVIGHSDFHLEGTLSDLPAIFHAQTKPVTLSCRAHSRQIILRELLNIDTAKTRHGREEIYGFNIGASLHTSVHELLHPHPLPRGILKIDGLQAAFKRYPHAFHDFGAQLTINDSTLRLHDFAGRIDSSDLHLSARVRNYALWFDKVKKGKTQIAFDLKSQRLAMKDLLGRRSRKHVPKDYQDEVATNLWLRSKTDLRYDSVLRFANIKIAHVSGELKKHAFQLDSISGNVKFSASSFIKIDTLRGKIGRTDFDLNMRIYTGDNPVWKAKENYLEFKSRFLDLDQLSNYRLAAAEEDSGQSNGSPAPVVAAASTTTPSVHAGAFNIFQIPFIDFRATVQVGKVKYHHLWLKDLFTNIRMQADQQLYLDTLRMQAAGGTIAARAHFNGSNPEKIYLFSKINVTDVNLEKLMLKLDYFGQDYVVNKNIRGRLTGQIRSYVQVYPDLTPLIDHSRAKLEVNIYDGMLVNFAPMQAMSSYFKDKNLNRVRFDTLQNTLSFKDNTLTIPAMNINSSLGFMEISGTQSLDEKMQYHLRIPLKMVTRVGFKMLFGKKKEEVDPDQVDAIEYRDKDKKVRFMNLTITGTPDDYKVRLGKGKKAKEG